METQALNRIADALLEVNKMTHLSNMLLAALVGINIVITIFIAITTIKIWWEVSVRNK